MISKKSYEAPAVLVLELESEGTVCQSAVMNVMIEEEIW